MEWIEVFVVFCACHLVGDYLLQTDWQATHKRGGLGTVPESRRALLSHVATYTLAFTPALVWLADDIGVGVLAVVTLIAGPHMVQDDGRLVSAYVRRVKGANPEPGPLLMAVDQSFHIIGLLFVAWLAAGLK